MLQRYMFFVHRAKVEERDYEMKKKKISWNSS